MITDYSGRSYRQELLKAICRLNDRDDLDPPRLAALQLLLKDLHDLDYSLAADAEEELRAELATLKARLDQVEALAGVRRHEPLRKIPGRLAPS